MKVKITRAEAKRGSLRMIARYRNEGNRGYRRSVLQHWLESHYAQVRLGSRLFDLINERRFHRTWR